MPINIGSLCRRALVWIDAGATLHDAAAAMRAQHVGTLIVSARNEDRRDAVGLVTDRDIAMAVAASHLDPDAVLVGAIANKPLVTIDRRASAAEATHALARNGVRRIAITDEHGCVIGLLSSDDLLAALIEPLQALAQSYRADIEREEDPGSTSLSAPAPGPIPMISLVGAA